MIALERRRADSGRTDWPCQIILAEILKEYVAKFRSYEIQFIENQCIIEDVCMDQVFVGQDTEDTEDKSHKERLD